MNSFESIRTILLEDLALQIQQLKDKYVGEGKPIKEEDFRKIEEVAHGKFYILAWLTKKIGTALLKTEDLYKWKEYIDIFEKNKKKFKFQDLNLFKTSEDLQNFIETALQIKEGDVKYEDIPQSSAFLSKNEIEKLTSTGGNKYLGFWKPEKGLKAAGSDGYQVFEISEPTRENWKVYRDLLGRCKGREKGASIEICTIAHYSYFKDYLKGDKGSKYIVLFNLNDSLSPYQLHVESQQFMNKNDVERYNFDKDLFLKWLSEKSEYYDFEKIASYFDWYVPIQGKGFENEKGKQGLWKNYDDGDLEGIYTFVDNKRNGPAVTFQEKGKPYEKGTFRETRNTMDWVGDYESVDEDGKIIKKGKWDDFGRTHLGVWQFGRKHDDWGVNHIFIDFDGGINPVSGMTSSGKLKVIADGERQYYGFIGKVIVFFPSGMPKAIGQLTQTGKKTGKWTVFNPDGSTKLEGTFRLNKPIGEWTLFFESKKGTKYLYVFDFNEPESGKLYDKEGNFIKKMSYGSDKIPDVRNFFKF